MVVEKMKPNENILLCFKNEFWVNGCEKYLQKLLSTCFVCERLQLQSYSYPEKSNLPGYRVNHTLPSQL